MDVRDRPRKDKGEDKELEVIEAEVVEPKVVEPKVVEPKVVERDEEDFIKSVDKMRLQDRSVEERVAYRADGRYYQLLSYRGTEKQKELIDFAAAEEKMSIQKLLENILMPALEERYGEKLGG